MRQGLDLGLFQRITDAAQIDAVLDALMATDWVVYSKSLSLIHISEPTRHDSGSRMPASA